MLRMFYVKPTFSSHGGLITAFRYISYTDDTTFCNIIQVSVGAPLDINNQLAKIHDWLAVNKLSLNAKQTIFMFHDINGYIEELVPELQ